MQVLVRCAFADPELGATVNLQADENDPVGVLEMNVRNVYVFLSRSPSVIRFWKLHKAVTTNDVGNGMVATENPSKIAVLMEEECTLADYSLRPGDDDTSLVRVIITVQRSLARFPALPSLLQERKRFIENDLPELPPSTAAAPSRFKEHQRTHRNPFLFNRPTFPDDHLPTTLLHPVFGKFVDLCTKYSPTIEDYALATDLLAMSEVYPDEASRAETFRSILADYDIKLEPSSIGVSGYRTDGHLQFQKFVLVILEAKNEIGTGGRADPFMEATLYYAKFLKQYPRNWEYASVLPCFQIALFGPCVAFSGTVFTGKIHSDVLAPILPLFVHAKDRPTQTVIARTFGAFRAALKDLWNYYVKLESSAPMLGPGTNSFRLEYPYPSSYGCKPELRSFTYHKDQPIAKKNIFYASLQDGSEIYLKFVRHYCPEVHNFCAAKGHAPQLLACESLPGGWLMVVMEALDTRKGDLPLTSLPLRSYHHFTYHRDAAWDPQPLYNAIQDFINDLHQNNYVHGDLRDVNFLVANDQDHRTDFMLLDFDWAGKINESRYPLYVNRKQIRRPDGALDGELILPEHDLEMIKFMFTQPGLDPLADQEIFFDGH